MNTITLNGEVRQIRDGTSLHEIVLAMIDAPKGVAVAVNREVIPRSAWATTFPSSGAQIEVVSAAAGG